MPPSPRAQDAVNLWGASEIYRWTEVRARRRTSRRSRYADEIWPIRQDPPLGRARAALWSCRSRARRTPRCTQDATWTEATPLLPPGRGCSAARLRGREGADAVQPHLAAPRPRAAREAAVAKTTLAPHLPILIIPKCANCAARAVSFAKLNYLLRCHGAAASSKPRSAVEQHSDSDSETRLRD